MEQKLEWFIDKSPRKTACYLIANYVTEIVLYNSMDDDKLPDEIVLADYKIIKLRKNLMTVMNQELKKIKSKKENETDLYTFCLNFADKNNENNHIIFDTLKKLDIDTKYLGEEFYSLVEIDKENDFVYIELADEDDFDKCTTYYINLDYSGQGSVVNQSVEPNYALVNAFSR